MIWLIYFFLAIASGAWVWLTGQWIPLVVVCGLAIVTIILESVVRQNQSPEWPPVVNVTDCPTIHRGGETWFPYIGPDDDVPGK